jgi:hypothetical protein
MLTNALAADAHIARVFRHDIAERVEGWKGENRLSEEPILSRQARDDKLHAFAVLPHTIVHCYN